MSAHTHIRVSQAVPLEETPGPNLLPTPRPRIGVLTGCRVCAPAHLYAHAQYVVVDLEEPRGLRPTIGYPAGGAMHHPAYQLRGTTLLRGWVNKRNLTVVLQKVLYWDKRE